MHIKIEKKSLELLLFQAQTVVEKKTNNNQLMNVYLKVEKNELFIYATDLEVGLVGQIACEVFKEGTAAVNAKTFYEVTHELSDSPIFLESKENNWLDIKQDKFQSKIIGIPPEVYPMFALKQPKSWLTLPGDKLKNLISKTDYAMSNDVTRTYLYGIYLEQTSENDFTMVATDGHRLAVANESFDNINQKLFEEGIIIPKKGIIEIKKLIEDSSNKEIKISTDKTQFYIQRPGVTLSIRLVEHKYPPFRKLIPKNKYVATINRNTLLSSVKRVSLFSSLKSKAISIQLNENVMQINTITFELGDAFDEININYDGPKMTVTYNSKFLIDALNTIEDSELELLIDNPEKAAIIRGKKANEYINIIMPMRV